MNLPAGGAAIVQQLYEHNLEMARGSDDERRALTTMIAETFCARFGPDWGTKATTARHPRSKDAIAHRGPQGTIDVWDWQNGATRAPQIRDGQPPTYPDARTGPGGPPQFFVEVAPVDHLAPPPTPDPPKPPDQPSTPAPPKRDEQLERLIDTLQHLAGELEQNNMHLSAVSDLLDRLLEKGIGVHL